MKGAISDSNGELIWLLRMDGLHLPSIDVAKKPKSSGPSRGQALQSNSRCGKTRRLIQFKVSAIGFRHEYPEVPSFSMISMMESLISLPESKTTPYRNLTMRRRRMSIA